MKKTLKRLNTILILGVVLIGIIGNVNFAQAQNTYKVNCESTILSVGENQTLWLDDGNGNRIYPSNWYSYNEAKATISKNGVVTANANLGSPTTVACWRDDVKYTCIIYIRDKNSIEYGMNVPSTTVYTGGNITQKVYLKGSDGTIVNPGNWYSYNEAKATINQNGEITAKPGAEGTSTTVACWKDGIKYTCVVYIKNAGPNRLGKQYMLTGEDMYFQLSGFAGTTTYSSSKPSVATIDRDGVAHACGAGVTTITMRNGSHTYTCELVVTECRLNVVYKNSNTVQLQKIWEYGPNPGFRRMWNALYNNVYTKYTFKSEQQYLEALAFYYNITGDRGLLARNPIYYMEDSDTYVLIVFPNSDNVAYTRGTKGLLKYYKQAYDDILSLGITNGMDVATAYKKLANYVSANVSYSPAPESNYLYEFYNFYTDRHFVCNGYSEMMHILCTMCSIQSVRSTGNALMGGYHAWNEIYLNGTWYNSDICWYDLFSENSKTYYLLSTLDKKWHQKTEKDTVLWCDWIVH